MKEHRTRAIDFGIKVLGFPAGKQDVVTPGAMQGYCRGTSSTLIGHCRTLPGHRLLRRISSLLPNAMLVAGTVRDSDVRTDLETLYM